MRNRNDNLTQLTWPTLRAALRQYFRPADFKRRARDELANCTQKGAVTNYIDRIKRIA